MSEEFWRVKSLEEMTDDEWEALCDGRARCCLIKLEDEETDEIHYTGVACRYLNQEVCRCSRYRDRSKIVPNCVQLTPSGARNFKWLPKTCAYRLVASGRDLPEWHYLISGSRETVHTANISIKDKCLSEEFVHPDALDEQIIQWVELSDSFHG